MTTLQKSDLSQSILSTPKVARNSLTTPLEWKSTCHTSMMDAMGTTMGLKKKVRNCDFRGIRHSSISASTSESTTARGTATPVNTTVFFTAS